MVKQFGMSERLGPVAFGRKQQMVFLGRDLGEQQNYSEEIGEVIDQEIRRLIDDGYARAVSVLSEHRDLLERIAAEPIKIETLDASAAGCSTTMAANALSVQGERVRRPPIKYTRNAARQRYSTTMLLWASSSHGPMLALVALTRPPCTRV
jgi:hypothetical protein